MLPKYKVGSYVSINKNGTYKVLEITVHGGLMCDCCPKAGAYFMYRISNTVWINEDQLLPIIVN